MDFKTSNKTARQQPDGAVYVLTDNVFDLYPVFGNSDAAASLDLRGENDPENLIIGAEILDGGREEMLDRATFAVVKQRGQDPLNPHDGIQWAETIIGEVPTAALMIQIQKSVSDEGPGVRVEFEALKRGTESVLSVRLKIVNPRG